MRSYLVAILLTIFVGNAYAADNGGQLIDNVGISGDSRQAILASLTRAGVFKNPQTTVTLHGFNLRVGGTAAALRHQGPNDSLRLAIRSGNETRKVHVRVRSEGKPGFQSKAERRTALLAALEKQV